MSLQSKNARGEPICPACDRAIRIGESVIRHADHMLHVDCWFRLYGPQGAPVGPVGSPNTDVS